MTDLPVLGFGRDVKRRLGAGAIEYGDRSYGRPLAELLEELLEECADIGGWARIAASALEQRGDREECERAAIVDALRVAQTLAAAAWRQLDDARPIVREVDHRVGA
jgi:hypothetical protein